MKMHRDREPHVQQVFHRGPRIVAGREPVEVAAVFVAVVEVADHQDRGALLIRQMIFT